MARVCGFLAYKVDDQSNEKSCLQNDRLNYYLANVGKIVTMRLVPKRLC